ncbi:MAG: site-specific integrase [Elusimicrobiota bacterium]
MQHLKKSEIGKLVSVYKSQEDAASLRNTAILQILCAYGFEVQELLSLKIADIDIWNYVITLPPGKYGKREIPLTKKVRRAIKRWLIARNILKPRSQTDFIFINIKAPYKCLSKKGVIWLVTEAGKIALGKKITPKVLRASFIILALKKGWPNKQIQTCLDINDQTFEKRQRILLETLEDL